VSKKRGNGEASITKRKDGRWVARYTVHTAKAPERRHIYGRTRQEVAAKLAKAMTDRDGGIELDPSSVTVHEYLQGLYRDRSDAGLSPCTVQRLHAVIHRALKQALRWGLIARNVSEATDPRKAQRKEIRPLTPEQVRTLLKTARGDRLEALYALAITTGLSLNYSRR
jgi:integrase